MSSSATSARSGRSRDALPARRVQVASLRSRSSPLRYHRALRPRAYGARLRASSGCSSAGCGRTREIVWQARRIRPRRWPAPMCMCASGAVPHGEEAGVDAAEPVEMLLCHGVVTTCCAHGKAGRAGRRRHRPLLVTLASRYRGRGLPAQVLGDVTARGRGVGAVRTHRAGRLDWYLVCPFRDVWPESSDCAVGTYYCGCPWAGRRRHRPAPSGSVRASQPQRVRGAQR